MAKLKPELRCLSTMAETLEEFGDDLLIVAEFTPGIDPELLINIVDNINGERPLRMRLDEEESVKRIIDFINFRGEYDPVTHNLYETALYKECPALYKDRMKDLQYRWLWANNCVSDPFVNCGGLDNAVEYAIERENIMGANWQPMNINRQVLSTSIKINDIYMDDILPWYDPVTGTGVILAGGAVTSTLYGGEFKASDYDFFVIEESETAAKIIIRDMLHVLYRKYRERIHICVKEHVISVKFYQLDEEFELDTAFSPIQIITRVYNSPTQVINGFDIDACCVGYYPKSGIFMSTRATRCFKNGWLLVDPMCQSPSYEYRLAKYAKRYKLGIYIPLYKNIDPYAREFVAANCGIRSLENYIFVICPTLMVYEKGLPLLKTLMTSHFNFERGINKKTDYENSETIKYFYEDHVDNINNVEIKIIMGNPQSQGQILCGSINPTYTNDFYLYYKPLIRQILLEKNNYEDIRNMANDYFIKNSTSDVEKILEINRICFKLRRYGIAIKFIRKTENMYIDQSRLIVNEPWPAQV